MTYYGGRELAEAFRTVRANTIRIAEDIPEDQYGFRPAADTRSVAQMLAHIGVATHFQTHVHVNKITDNVAQLSNLVPLLDPSGGHGLAGILGLAAKIKQLTDDINSAIASLTLVGVLGDLAMADRVSAEGLAQIQPGQVPAATLHVIAWRTYVLTLLGRWDENLSYASH